MILYDLEITDYHAAPEVSHSGLRDFAELGPAGFFHRHVRGENRRKTSAAMVGGQNLEDFLGGWEPQVVPDELPDARGKVAPRKEDSEVVKRFLVDNPGHVTRSVYETYKRQRDSIMANATARALLEMAKPQVTFRADRSGLPGIQARPDFAILDSWMGDVFVDLKRTESLDTFKTNVRRLGHNTQAGMARLVAKECGLVPEWYWLVVETGYPTRAQLFRPSELTLATGELWCDRQLEALAEHYTADHWPSTVNDVEELHSPVPGVYLDETA